MLSLTVLLLVNQLLRPVVPLTPPEQEIFKKLFDEGNYNKNIEPVNTSDVHGPVAISVQVYVHGINNIDSLHQDWKLQLSLRQQWTDERLKFDYYNYNPRYVMLTKDLDRVWTPAIYFPNAAEVKVPNPMENNQYIRIYPDGQVTYSSRINLRLFCPMVLTRFPMDQQTCQIIFGSYGHTTKMIKYKWLEPYPLELASHYLNIESFVLKHGYPTQCTNYVHSEMYSCLSAEFIFKRNFKPYLINFFIPCGILVFVSFTTFWMSTSRLATARLVVATTTLFVLIWVILEASKGVPPNNYWLMIDYYIIVCVSLAFSAVIEGIIVIWLYEKFNKLRYAEQDRRVAQEENGKLPEWKLRMICCISKISSQLDMISRILFPFAFIIFNIRYWRAELF